MIKGMTGLCIKYDQKINRKDSLKLEMSNRKVEEEYSVKSE